MKGDIEALNGDKKDNKIDVEALKVQGDALRGDEKASKGANSD